MDQQAARGRADQRIGVSNTQLTFLPYRRVEKIVKAATAPKQFAEWMPSTGFSSHMAMGAEATRDLEAEIERVGSIARGAGLLPT